MVGEYIKKGGIDDKRVLDPKMLLPMADQLLIHADKGNHPCELPDFRKVPLHGRSKRHWGDSQINFPVLSTNHSVDPVDILHIRMIAVIAILIPDVEQDIKATKRPRSKTENIYKAVGLVFQQEPHRGLPITF